MSNKFGDTYNPDRDFLPDENEGKSLRNVQSRINEIVNDEELPPKHSPKKINWLLAALFFCLLGAIYLIWKNQAEVETLPMAYFDAFPNYERVDTRGESQSDMLKVIYGAYDDGEFENVVELFSKYSNPLTPEDQLYYAIALQGTGEWKRSKEILIQIQSKIKPSYRPANQWHLALAHLDANEREQTVELLTNLKNKKSAFKQKASELLRDLNR